MNFSLEKLDKIFVLTLSSSTIPRQSVDIDIAQTSAAIAVVTTICLHNGALSLVGNKAFSTT